MINGIRKTDFGLLGSTGSGLIKNVKGINEKKLLMSNLHGAIKKGTTGALGSAILGFKQYNLFLLITN